MNAPPPVDFDTFVSWYQSGAQVLIRELVPEHAAEWDSELAGLLRDSAEPLPETAVCFLGNSGVGKSTLINALVAGADDVLPAGGVGPLTAQALEVRYAERASFTARYYSAATLNKVVFGLRRAFASELGLEAAAQDEVPPDADQDGSSILYAARSETSSNSWKLRVMSEANGSA